ncbi:MFS transporter [Sporosarcina sp. resist]|uniref:MFS transporter n=1 Tax=Sporosarcina sp. resist TaxID=2762563 RepID=UPI00164DC067|nr:MFS transporter [Sporosarcina sp. resist]QNK89106.1 MFS transporter [Sporosarcina sp. resist]
MKFRDLHINIRIRIAVDFVQKIFNNMIIPFMAIYLTNHFGLKIAGILMIFAISMGILSSFYGGYYSDLKGRRRVLLIAEFINSIVFISMAIVNSSWFILPFITYILYVIHNIVVYSATPAADAMLIDVSTPEIRKYVYSISYWVVNFSFGIGSIMGAFFYNEYFFEVLIASGISTMIIFFIYLFFIMETKPIDSNVKIHKVNLFLMAKSYKKVLSDKIFLVFVIASLLLMSIELQLANYISVRLTSEFPKQNLFGFFEISGIEMYGLLRAENTFLVISLAFLVERISRKFDDVKRLCIGAIIFTLGYMVVGVSNSIWVLIIATFIFTIGEMLYVPIKQTFLSILVDENSRTQYMAVYSLHFRFALIIASFSITLGGYISSISMSLIYAVLGSISTLLFYKLIKNSKLV